MTSKQCNSCKKHICVKELGDCCYLSTDAYFMKNKNCPFYEYGEINQGHKEYFKRVGREYPFAEMR